MRAFFDMVRFSTSATGTGPITVAGAILPGRTPAQAGVSNGTVVSYSILDGSNFETGQGTYSSSGILSRDVVFSSSNNGLLINLSGGALVHFDFLAEDVSSLVVSPTGTIGLTAVPGSAATAAKSDGTPALSQAIVPTWTGLHTFSGGAIVPTQNPGDNSNKAASTQYVANAVGAGVTPAALTSANDTNVTVTLGGAPSTALLQAASLTLGWSGTLAVGRGGIGVGTLGSNCVLYGNGTSAVQALAVNASGTNKFLSQVSSGVPTWATIASGDVPPIDLSSSGNGGVTNSLPIANLAGGVGASSSTFLRGDNTWAIPAGGGGGITPAALTETDDTNVTLTLGGSPSTSLLQATSLTLGWTGTLAASRLNSNVVQSVSNDTNITGSIAAQALTLAWSGTLGAARLNSSVVQGVTNDTNITGSIAAQTLTFGWTGTLAVPRGGTGVASLGSNCVLYGNGTGGIQALTVNSTATNKFLTQVSAGTPTWGTLVSSDVPPINLASTANGGITGNLGVTHLNSGTSASATTYWRGDGTWAPLGMVAVTSIAALQAVVPITGQIAFLNLGGRSGIWAWNGGASITTQVTNDPGQGIYIALGSTPSGANGGWIRQYSGVEVHAPWWGYVADATPTVDPWELLAFTQTANGRVATFTGTVTGTATIITAASVTGTITVGDGLTGTGVPVGTTIVNQLTGTTGGAGTYTTSNPTTSSAAAIISGGFILTGIPDTSQILPNMRAQGTGISNFANTPRSNTIVLSVDSSSQITLSRPLIANISGGTIIFSGPVPGTGTDNSITFINIGIWARTQTSVYIKFPQGTGLWNGNTVSGGKATYAWINGITNLTIDGCGGAFWQNTYNAAVSGANSGSGANFPLSDLVTVRGYLINNTVIGNTFFSLMNVADVAASGIYPGMVIVVGCGDPQTLGYPPNMRQFEYVTVKSIVGNIVNIVEAFKYVHLSTLPDYNAIPTISNSCGVARMWVMPDPAWQGKLIIKDMSAGLAPSIPQGPYVTLCKLFVQTINWVGPGFSETSCRDVVHDNLSPRTSGETDKMLDNITYNNPIAYAGGAFPFQSANPNRLIINGGAIASLVGLGKQTIVRGTKIALFQAASTFGMCDSVLLDYCDVPSAPGTGTGNVIDAATPMVIDGTNVTWSNGFLTLIDLPLSANGLLGHWNVMSGMWVNLQAIDSTGGVTFSNDIGTGYIISDTENPTALVGTTTATGGAFPGNTATVSSAAGLGGGMAVSGTGIGTGAKISTIVGTTLTLSVANTATPSGTLTFTQPIRTIETSLKQFATLPSWATGSIYLFKVNEIEARHCIGDSSIRRMSAASAAGQRYFEYNKCEFGGINGQNITINNPIGTQLLEVDVNVVTASSIANAVLTIIITTVNNSTFVRDSGSGTVITIRLDIAGSRKITTSAFEGYPTGSGTLDNITVGGTASATLPPNRLLGPSTTLQFFSQASSTAASPLGEIIIKTSAGMVRKPFSRQYDDLGIAPLTTATGTVGVNTIVVASATGLVVGMECCGGGVGNQALITNISGTTITLSVVNWVSFTAQAVIFSFPVGHALVQMQGSLP